MSTDAASGLERYLAARRAEVESALTQYLPPAHTPPVLADAMRYSLLAGGKRLRPLLTLAAADAAGGPDARSLAMPAACAIEMIHTYSLIHDDLPAMDDDILRRGRPTLHVVAGDGMAILAGDGLQAEAFGLLAREPFSHDPALVARKLRVIEIIAGAAGAAGMVGGQAIDLGAAFGGKFSTAKGAFGAESPTAKTSSSKPGVAPQHAPSASEGAFGAESPTAKTSSSKPGVAPRHAPSASEGAFGARSPTAKTLSSKPGVASPHQAAPFTADDLEQMHARKTGALIRASAVAGAIMAGADEHVVTAIDRYAADIGLAFQIVDDVLDVEAASQTLGKTAGKDAAAGKPTYPALFGIARSRELARECLERAEAELAAVRLDRSYLAGIAHWIVARRS
ncbi:MAG TPA: polyprenyl synthetase family protein [Vicinamibacterales bacterium]|nr:polyprenyl synthetase family protein [Vicinamibacterales bacterium]